MYLLVLQSKQKKSEQQLNYYVNKIGRKLFNIVHMEQSFGLTINCAHI